MAVAGAALRITSTFLYVLCFCCTAIILGIYSYFLSVRADHHDGIPTWEKAVEGISGAGVLYTIFAMILTCCLGGKTFFAFLAIVLDVLFVGGMVAIAVMTRHGVGSCSGNNVHSPLGNGPSSSRAGYGSSGFGTSGSETVTYSASIGFACRLNKVCFAVAVIGAFLFLLSAVFQLWLGRHTKREKAFGPSPTNNYTSGSSKKGKWFQRKKKTSHATKDAELGAAAVGAGGLAAHHHNENRHSHDTAYTGTTAGHNGTAPSGTYAGEKYEPQQPTIPTTGGYHTGPHGTSVNPYGYGQTTGTTHQTPATNY